MTLEFIIHLVVTVVGILMSFGYYPQAWKIYKTKSAASISLSAYGVFIVGTTVWFLYGIYKADWVIALSFVFGVIGSWLVFILTLYYRHPVRDRQTKGL